MSMTRLNIRDEVAARSRIVDADIGEKTILNNFINRTLEEIQVFSKWWFLEHEFVLNTSQAPVLAAGTREYAFPALDIDGNTADLSEIDRQSMHTKSEHMEWTPKAPECQDEIWMDQLCLLGRLRGGSFDILRFDARPGCHEASLRCCNRIVFISVMGYGPDKGDMFCGFITMGLGDNGFFRCGGAHIINSQ